MNQKIYILLRHYTKIGNILLCNKDNFSISNLCMIGKGTYGGIAVDADGKIIGTRTDKGRSIIQVLKLGGGTVLTEIDSHTSKLRRPSGIAVLPDNHLVVVDLGNDCIKKYRYW